MSSCITCGVGLESMSQPGYCTICQEYEDRIAEFKAEIAAKDEEIAKLRIENTRMSIKIRAADAVMVEIDRMVQIGKLSSRSGIADRRLDYSEPFKYLSQDKEIAKLLDTLRQIRDMPHDHASQTVRAMANTAINAALR